MIIFLMLIIPLFFCGIILWRPAENLRKSLVLFYAVLHLSCSICLSFSPGCLSKYFQTDELNILFLLILSFVFLAIAVYNLDFSRHKDEAENNSRNKFYTVFLLIFVDSMNGILLSSNLGLLWVFLEASTLSSAMLVYHYGNKTSLEAAWKYIFICSIGISFAFIGIIFLSMGSVHIDSLFFKDLNEGASNQPFLVKISIAISVGGFWHENGAFSHA